MGHAICVDADLPDGAMRAVEAAGRKILLARVAGTCHAIGAICPHAGGPLAEDRRRTGPCQATKQLGNQHDG